MGTTRKIRRKYSKPRHPWEQSRIEDERVLKKEYGLKNKKEIWKASSIVKRFKDQTKKLTASSSEQSKKEEKQLLNRLYKLNLLEKDSKLDDVLKLTVKDVLNRRLQSIVYKKGLTKTIDQARQFIVHGHVAIKNRKINVPSYLLLRGEEDHIGFASKSKFTNPDHPEMIKETKQA